MAHTLESIHQDSEKVRFGSRIPTAFCLLAITSWPDVPLVGVNAFVAALAAMGAYEVSFEKFLNE